MIVGLKEKKKKRFLDHIPHNLTTNLAMKHKLRQNDFSTQCTLKSYNPVVLVMFYIC